MKTEEATLDSLGEILLNWRIRTVSPYVKGHLLDVGCGTNKLVRQHGNGVGMDVFQFGGADLIVPDTSKTPFEDKTFDTITILAALNHIPNRDDVLVEMKRILKDDGHIIITMPTPFISRIWHFIRKPWDRDQHERGMKEGETFGFTGVQLRAIVQKSGFTVRIEKRFMFGVNRMIVCQKN